MRIKLIEIRVIENKLYSLGFSKIPNTSRYVNKFSSFTMEIENNVVLKYSIWVADSPGYLYEKEKPSVKEMLDGIDEHLDKDSIRRKKFEEFYDKFLLKDETEHLDLTMNKAWRHDIRVCLPMVCKQMSGWSDNEKVIKDWAYKEHDKPFF